MEGTVKFYNRVKGYGFITTESDGDIFVHATQLGEEKIRDGQRVSFELIDAPKGKQAKNVKGL